MECVSWEDHERRRQRRRSQHRMANEERLNIEKSEEKRNQFVNNAIKCGSTKCSQLWPHSRSCIVRQQKERGLLSSLGCCVLWLWNCVDISNAVVTQTRKVKLYTMLTFTDTYICECRLQILWLCAVSHCWCVCLCVLLLLYAIWVRFIWQNRKTNLIKSTLALVHSHLWMPAGLLQKSLLQQTTNNKNTVEEISRAFTITQASEVCTKLNEPRKIATKQWNKWRIFECNKTIYMCLCERGNLIKNRIFGSSSSNNDKNHFYLKKFIVLSIVRFQCRVYRSPSSSIINEYRIRCARDVSELFCLCDYIMSRSSQNFIIIPFGHGYGISDVRTGAANEPQWHKKKTWILVGWSEAFRSFEFFFPL